MNIDDVLALLTPEQLEQLAELKRKEQSETIEDKPQTHKPKRKQQRRRKQNKQKKDPYGGDHEGIPKGKGKLAKSSELTLGKRPNLFIQSSEFDSHKKDIEIDKKLLGNNKITARQTSRTVYLTATCSKCKHEFDDVPSQFCYKDDDGYVFVCDSCQNSMRG